MEAPLHARPSASDRLLAAAYYAGLAPALGGSRKRNAYLAHHYEQALAVWFVLLCIIGLYVVFSLFLSYILVFRRGWYEDTWVEPTLLTFVRRAFLCWIVFWVFATAWGLLGSLRPVPFIGGLGKVAWIRRVSVAGMAIVLVFTVLVAALTTHARALIRHDDATAEAYLLYDDMGFVPHWLFDLGFYPIALAATDRWGQGSVVTRPLTPERLAAAVSEGRFVFVLSHGTEDGLYTADFRVRPNEAAPHGTGEDLQLVYITGCDNGLLAREWEETLAPARVITFPRLSAWIEHIYWLLVTGPGEVGGLN